MAIHDEMAVGSLFVLADARFDERRILHRGKTESHVLADSLQGRRADNSLAGRGIEFTSTRIVGDFEPPAVVAWDAVEESLAMIAPHGQLGISEVRSVARRLAEEKDVLL